MNHGSWTKVGSNGFYFTVSFNLLVFYFLFIITHLIQLWLIDLSYWIMIWRFNWFVLRSDFYNIVFFLCLSTKCKIPPKTRTQYWFWSKKNTDGKSLCDRNFCHVMWEGNKNNKFFFSLRWDRKHELDVIVWATPIFVSFKLFFLFFRGWVILQVSVNVWFHF